MDTNNQPEIKIIRIESNFSPSPSYTIGYDVLKKAVTITNIEKPDEDRDKYITITVTYRMKV